VGQIGSGVRVNVSFQQKYPPGSVLRCPTAAEKLGYDQGGCVRGGVDLRLRRIMSSSSQILPRRLVRTTDDGRRGVLDTRRRPSRLYYSHFATRNVTVDNTVDLYAAKPDIRSESRFLPTLPAFDASVRRFPSEYRHSVWRGKTRMAFYPMVKNFEDIFIRFGTIHERDGRTDRQTDRHRMPTYAALVYRIARQSE